MNQDPDDEEHEAKHDLALEMNANGVERGEQNDKEIKLHVLFKLLMLSMPFLWYTLSRAIFLVFAFYVLETMNDSDFSWTQSDIGVFYSIWGIGSFVQSQVFQFCVSRETESDLIIQTLHLFQICVGCVAWFLMSSLFAFNYWQFALAMFLIGFADCDVLNQIYVKQLAGNDARRESKAMSFYSVCKQFARLACCAIGPALYDTYGFNVYVIHGVIAGVLYAIIIVGVILYLNSNTVSAQYAASPNNDVPDQQDQRNRSRKASLASSSSVARRARYKYVSISNVTSLSFSKWLTSSMAMSIVAYCFGSALTTWLDVSVSILMVEEFKISTLVFGHLNIAAQVYAIFGSRTYLLLHEKFPLFEYPYDFIAMYSIIIIGCLLLAMLVPAVTTSIYLAIAVYPVTVAAIKCIETVEMTSRIFLSPKAKFNQMSGLLYITEAAFAIIFGFITPLLLRVSDKFPMLMAAAVWSALCVSMVLLVIKRKRTLKESVISEIIELRIRSNLLSTDRKGKIPYLLMETMCFEMMVSSLPRRNTIIFHRSPLQMLNLDGALLRHRRISSIVHGSRQSQQMIMEQIVPPELAKEFE